VIDWNYTRRRHPLKERFFRACDYLINQFGERKATAIVLTGIGLWVMNAFTAAIYLSEMHGYEETVQTHKITREQAHVLKTPEPVDPLLAPPTPEFCERYKGAISEGTTYQLCMLRVDIFRLQSLPIECTTEGNKTICHLGE
jgi:hypothetical protein